ncbi:phosphatase PAP2 family protein [Paenirhodobacter sp.]|uniref:phosphatase PAP2 family protein n=1 Tax=Paenirhodobacter sp. TaxID=1965326 RepID=UPI003B3C8297
MLPRIDLSLTGRWLLAGWLAAGVLFWGAPSVDLDIARLFWRDGAGFTLIDRPLWDFLRNALWNAEIVVFAVALVAWIRAGLKGRDVLGMGARAWGFVAGLFLLAPGLLANGWLKSHSGRARPADIIEFGGDRLFTPAGSFADQCAKNCAFVSGEVSAAVALGVALWLVSAVWRLEPWQRIYLRVAGVLIPVFITVQRLTTGRHFASDAVFATLLTLAVGWGLYALLTWRRG